MVSLLIFNFCRIIEVFKINKIRFIEMIRWYNTGKCIGNLGYICILDFMDLIYSFSLLNTFCALLFVLNHTQVVEKIYNEKQVRLKLACTIFNFSATNWSYCPWQVRSRIWSRSHHRSKRYRSWGIWGMFQACTRLSSLCLPRRCDSPAWMSGAK